MQITVFGASGKVGRLVAAEALQRGLTVVAFVHSHPLPIEDARLITRTGDIYRAADVAEALRGSDAVVSCLGSWGTKRKDVLSSFVANVAPAMRAQNIPRIVTLTGVGVERDRPGWYRLAMRLMPLLPVAGKVFADADRHVQLLKTSGLRWATVCSPVMSNRGNAGYVLKARQRLTLLTISRQAVANAVVDQITTDDFTGQTPAIYRR
jgi:putative NADH-flavin reductase